MTTALFWAALLMSLASFVVFAMAVIAALQAATAAARKTAQGADTKGLVTMPDPIKLAEAFAKAGPTATAAALSIFFMFVALLVSGVVQLSVETKPAVEAAAKP